MNLEEAIRLSIKAYYTGTVPEQFMEQFPDMKFTPEYFANLESEIEDEMSGEEKGERTDEDEEELIDAD